MTSKRSNDDEPQDFGPARGRMTASKPDDEGFDIDGWLEAAYEDRVSGIEDYLDRVDHGEFEL